MNRSAFLDFEFDTQALPAEQAVATWLSRLHGFLMQGSVSGMAIDFPDWLPAAGGIGARPGSRLRLLGATEDLELLQERVATAQLLETTRSKVVAQGTVPAVHTFVSTTRCHRADRLAKILRNPGSIIFTGKEGEITDEVRLAARKIGMKPEVFLASQTLTQQLMQARRESVRFYCPSASTGKDFEISVRRAPLPAVSDVQRFSTYGLALDGTSIPSFTGV